MGAGEWTLESTKKWLLEKCVSARIEHTEEPAIRIKFRPEHGAETPPDHLIWEAFQLLKARGLITGHPVTADNVGMLPIWLDGVKLAPEGAEALESREEQGADQIAFRAEN
jgi:hypothetical protein